MMSSEYSSEILAGATADALENGFLDFKQCKDSVKSTLAMVADAAVCFANADGGIIVLGVADRAVGAAAFLGVPDEYTVDVIRRGIFDRTAPHLTALVEERDVAGKRIVEIVVPKGVAIHANSAGTSTRRQGKSCLPFTPDQQREVLAARGQVDFTSETTGATVADLSPNEVDRLRNLLILAGKEDLARLDTRGLLRDLRLSDEHGHIKVAGLILCGSEDALRNYVPTYGYSYQARSSGGSEADSTLRGERPLLAALAVIDDAIDARRSVRPLNLSGGVQLRLTDYPREAVRELVVNAFIHRSYETNGTVDIEHTPEHLSVTSPGGLVAGVTAENILTYPSTPRNRLLTETVALLQIAERTGQGVDRAYREMLRQGKRPPMYDDQGSLVAASLEGGRGDDAFVRFVTELPDDLAGDVEVLLVFAQFRAARALRAPDLAPITQRTANRTQAILRTLDERGYLIASRRTARGSFPSYRLTPVALQAMGRSVVYARHKVGDHDAKIIDHVREYGHVTNKTVQRLFDTNVTTARNIIRDMRYRGIVEKIGDARGGTGVTYGPGHNFPR